MAIALGLETVLTSIANLTVTDVQIRDIDEVPDAGEFRTSMLFPDPEGFITAFNVRRDSTGGGGTALMTVTYTLNYRFIFVPAGSLRNLANIYGNLAAKLIAIIEEMLENDDIAGAVDMEVQEIPTIGAVTDPSGTTWHGCTLSLRVTEFVN